MAETDEKIAEIGIIAETEKKISEIRINAKTEKKIVKIGINGLGKTGRWIARVILMRDDCELVALNDPFVDIYHCELSFYYDMFSYEVDPLRLEVGTHDSETFIFGEKRVPFFQKRFPENIPWGAVGADVVVESTGLFTLKGEAAGHLKGGAKKVIISAPSKDTPMFIVGVNDHEYNSGIDIISSGSSTSNCLAPLVKVINDKFGIVEGSITSILSDLAIQSSVEAGGARIKFETLDTRPLATEFVNEPEYFSVEDCRKSALSSYSSSCAAEDIGKVIPSLSGKLTGMSFRVKTLCVSIIDISVRLEKSVNYEDIKKAIREESEGRMQGILGITEENVCTINFYTEFRSSIVDVNAGSALSDKFVKVVAWYNNKWGYCSRVVDLITSISKV